MLQDIDCRIRPGYIVVVLGKNGAGKSTLLETIAGQNPIETGEVLLDGTPIRQLSVRELARRRAVLSQGMDMTFPLRVWEVVEMGAYVLEKPLPPRVRDQWIDRALEEAGLSGFRERRFDTLSGGEQKRALLAKCLLQLNCSRKDARPKYLLMDEPNASLDIEQQYKLIDRVRELVCEQNLGVLAVVHDLNLAASFADELLILQAGRLAHKGPPARILTPEILNETMGLRCLVQDHPLTGTPYIIPLGPAQTEGSLLTAKKIRIMENHEQIRQHLADLRQQEPRLRSRDLAVRLGISEAELVSLSNPHPAVRLEGDWKELLKSLKPLGELMALTRNEHGVHERKGVYDNLEFYEGAHNMGVAVNPDIDLRFFMNEWVHAFAVEMDRGKMGKLHSFQFFNSRGEAVHKIYSTPDTNIAAYHHLVDRFRAEEQTPLSGIDRSPYPEKEELPDASIDVETFQKDWRELQDTHDFFGLLKKYEVTRTQGLRLAPVGFTQKIDNEAVVRTLQMAADRKVPIMCFLHSRGCVQIHTGEVSNLKFYGDWYNVMDPKFNLHLDLPAVRDTWIVKKPTADGIVTSLELFDETGRLIVYFFGARKPGIPELESWREIIREVSLQEAL